MDNPAPPATTTTRRSLPAWVPPVGVTLIAGAVGYVGYQTVREIRRSRSLAVLVPVGIVSAVIAAPVVLAWWRERQQRRAADDERKP